MNNDLTYSWFRLFSVEGYGPAMIYHLYARARLNSLTICDLFEISQEEFEKVFAPRGREIYLTIHSQNEDAIRLQYEKLIENDVVLIHLEHQLYPQRMLKIFLDKAPVILFARGMMQLLSAKGVAVVGSREAEPKALEYSEKIAELCAQYGWNVISGYARGIDSCAHYGALKADGTTTMVLSYGLEHFYVRSIIKELPWDTNSLLVSQFHPRDSWKDAYGMIRNQLVVGLSDVVIVVQAGEKSGTVNTGEVALKAGVPLWVMSNCNFDSSAEGNKYLLDKGATKIDSIEEIEYKFKEIEAKSNGIGEKKSNNNQVSLPI